MTESAEHPSSTNAMNDWDAFSETTEGSFNVATPTETTRDDQSVNEDSFSTFSISGRLRQVTPSPMSIPTHSRRSSILNDSVSSSTRYRQTYRETVPWPNKTLLIRNHETQRIVTLLNGQLKASSLREAEGGCRWMCIERDGWFGFRNTVSGTHIGHNGKGAYIANVKHHKDYEYFSTRSHPEGGFLLLTSHDWKLRMMTLKADGQTLLETRYDDTDRRAIWEFLEVDVAIENSACDRCGD